MNRIFILLPILFLFLIPDSAHAQKVKPKVRIGKDTTYVTGPLTKDGYIDYLAHLNNVHSKGVTAENNGAVLLLKASPGEISDQDYLDRYCKALGIKPIPLKGDYYKNYYLFALDLAAKKSGNENPSPEEKKRIHQEVEEAYEKAGAGPWVPKENPLMAAWVEESEKHLELIRKASLRSKYYHPMLGSTDEKTGDMLIAVLLPQVQSSRSYARHLHVRINMYLGQGEIDKAFEDLLTLRRLGNMIGKGATIIEQLVGLAIIGIAQGSEQKMSLSGKVSGKDLERYLGKMEKVRAQTDMVSSFGECERLMYLDCVQHVMRGGISSLQELMGTGATKSKTRMNELLDKVITDSTDWSFTMQEGNRLYDKYTEKMNTTDWREKHKALEDLENEIGKIQEDVNSPTTMVRAFLGGPEFRGKIMGKIFVSMLFPALNAATTAENRVQITDDLTFAGIAVQIYKEKHGEYPENLRDVGRNIPKDRYSNADFIYRKEGDGFLIYSVGVNGKDDNGNGVMNNRTGQGDDYGFGYDSIKGKKSK